MESNPSLQRPTCTECRKTCLKDEDVLSTFREIILRTNQSLCRDCELKINRKYWREDCMNEPYFCGKCGQPCSSIADQVEHEDEC
jgi:hypothetical protein